MLTARNTTLLLALSILTAAILVACGNDKGTPAPTPTPAAEKSGKMTEADWEAYRKRQEKLKHAEEEAAKNAPVAPPEPIRTPQQIIGEKLSAASNLTSAINVLRSLMTDVDPSTKEGPGAFLLTSWMNEHPNWKELNELESTKFKLVQKDPESERGKVLCMRGSIVQIRVDRAAGFPVYLGGLMSYPNVLRFYAVGSTGDLVENRKAKFCGVVIGTESYANSGGGVTHAVKVVGMFDLKENKK